MSHASCHFSKFMLIAPFIVVSAALTAEAIPENATAKEIIPLVALTNPLEQRREALKRLTGLAQTDPRDVWAALNTAIQDASDDATRADLKKLKTLLLGQTVDVPTLARILAKPLIYHPEVERACAVLREAHRAVDPAKLTELQQKLKDFVHANTGDKSTYYTKAPADADEEKKRREEADQMIKLQKGIADIAGQRMQLYADAFESRKFKVDVEPADDALLLDKEEHVKGTGDVVATALTAFTQALTIGMASRSFNARDRDASYHFNIFASRRPGLTLLRKGERDLSEKTTLRIPVEPAGAVEELLNRYPLSNPFTGEGLLPGHMKELFPAINASVTVHTDGKNCLVSPSAEGHGAMDMPDKFVSAYLEEVFKVHFSVAGDAVEPHKARVEKEFSIPESVLDKVDLWD